MKTARGCRTKTVLGISESKLHLEFIIPSWKRLKKNLSHEDFHSFIYRTIKSLIYLRQWFLNCKLEQGTDILNLSHCFALIKGGIKSPEAFAWYKYHHFHSVFFRNLHLLLVCTWWDTGCIKQNVNTNLDFM